MKKSENLSKLSNDALLKTLNRAKNQFIGFMLFFVLLVIVCNYFTFTKGFDEGFGYYTLIPIPFATPQIGSQAKAIQLDITHSESVRPAVKLIENEFGYLTVVNNVAISHAEKPDAPRKVYWYRSVPALSLSNN